MFDATLVRLHNGHGGGAARRGRVMRCHAHIRISTVLREARKITGFVSGITVVVVGSVCSGKLS